MLQPDQRQRPPEAGAALGGVDPERRRPRRSGRGRARRRVRPVTPGAAAVHLGPVEADQAARPARRGRSRAGSNHGSAIRRCRSSTVQPPCSGWPAKASRVQRAPRPRRRGPGSKVRTVTPARHARLRQRRRTATGASARAPVTGGSRARWPARPPRGARRAPTAAAGRPASRRAWPRRAGGPGRDRRYAGCTTTSALAPGDLVGHVEVAVGRPGRAAGQTSTLRTRWSPP